MTDHHSFYKSWLPVYYFATEDNELQCSLSCQKIDQWLLVAENEAVFTVLWSPLGHRALWSESVFCQGKQQNTSNEYFTTLCQDWKMLIYRAMVPHDSSFRAYYTGSSSFPKSFFFSFCKIQLKSECGLSNDHYIRVICSFFCWLRLCKHGEDFKIS